MPGATWERVEETIEVDGGYVMTQDKDGTLFPMPTMISRDTSYYRLIPGPQSQQTPLNPSKLPTPSKKIDFSETF